MSQLENIRAQISRLRDKWTELAGKGEHAEAVGVENEIEALERASARHEVQAEAERNEAARARAVAAAAAKVGQIETHRAARAELELVVADIEAAAKALDAAMARVTPAWNHCVATYPRSETFRDSAQQAAYDEALGGNRYPNFEPLRLAVRLPLVLDTLRGHTVGGPGHILAAADTRF